MSSTIGGEGSDWEPSKEPSSSSPSYSSSPSSSNYHSSNHNSFGNGHGLGYDFDLEEDGIVDILIWKGEAGYDAFPDYMITCPLGIEALKQAYGVDLDAHPSYKAQVDAMESKLKDKPINLYKPNISTNRSKKMKMAPLEVGCMCGITLPLEVK